MKKAKPLTAVGGGTPALRGSRTRPVPDQSIGFPISQVSRGANDNTVVDLDKVSAIRQAIAQGRLKIDAAAIADKLLQSAR